jgi:hypothetical protein
MTSISSEPCVTAPQHIEVTRKYPTNLAHDTPDRRQPMKVQFEISREEIESVMQIGGRIYIEAADRPKNRELLGFLSSTLPSAMEQFTAYLRHKADSEYDGGDGDGDGQPAEEPNADTSDTSDTSEQAA